MAQKYSSLLIVFEKNLSEKEVLSLLRTYDRKGICSIVANPSDVHLTVAEERAVQKVWDKLWATFRSRDIKWLNSQISIVIGK